MQDNHSRSVRGTLRGLHSRMRRPQGKLVRVLSGEIFDVAADVRRGSPTFGRWVGVRLSAENFRQIYVPAPGFVHGFVVLSAIAEVEYKCTDLYDPRGELSVVWNDPDLAIDWPVSDPIVSPKDAAAAPLAALGDRLPAYEPSGWRSIGWWRTRPRSGRWRSEGVEPRAPQEEPLPVKAMPSSRTARSIFITGASTGIGRACALDLAASGYRVLATVRREADGERLREEHARTLRARDREKPGRATHGAPSADTPPGGDPIPDTGLLEPLLLDVTDEDSIDRIARRVEEVTGPAGLDGLVNNAGFAVAAPLELLSPAELRRQLDVNVTGAVAVTQALLASVRRARGRIVFIGSVSGLTVFPFLGAYSASKFALEAVADALRLELRPWGIGVTIVEPGSIDTPIWKKSRAEALERFERADPEAHRLYATASEAVLEATRKAAARAIPPMAVVRAVRRALFARRPPQRILVGRDARVQAWMRALLPGRWRDRIVLAAAGLSRLDEATQDPT